MRKKVCIDVTSIFPFFRQGFLSGIGRTTLELLQALSKEKNSLPFDIELFSQWQRKYDLSGSLKINFQHRNLLFPLKYLNKFSKHFPIKEVFVNADLWHVPHNTAFMFNPGQVVFTVHDMILYTCPNEFSEEQKQRALLIVSPLMKKCKAIITCSESSKKDIVKYLDVSPEKVHVIYWGVKHELFSPLENKEKLKTKIAEKYGINNSFFFSVSCGYGRKNTLELLKTYDKLLTNGPQNDLVIVWKNYGQDVAEIVDRSLGRIRVLSNIPDEDLAVLYNLATASFYPSKYEGFGLPVLESMACGTPVVTSFNSSLPEVGGEAVIYIDPENPDSLFEIMTGLENRVYDINAIREKGLRQASRFTWEKCARDTIAVYSQLLEE